jgi:3-phosphoinositide dependent protein kinase-1
VFEEGKHASDGTSALSVQEWVDTLDRAKETAAFHANTGNPYATEDGFRDLSSGVSSHSNTLNQSEQIPLPIHPAEGGRNALVKHQPGGGDSDSVKGRKRFSRQSKNGLSAIF